MSSKLIQAPLWGPTVPWASVGHHMGPGSSCQTGSSQSREPRRLGHPDLAKCLQRHRAVKGDKERVFSDGSWPLLFLPYPAPNSSVAHAVSFSSPWGPPDGPGGQFRCGYTGQTMDGGPQSCAEHPARLSPAVPDGCLGDQPG